MADTEKLLQNLRSLELRLLLCTIPSNNPLPSISTSESTTPLLSIADNFVQSIESGCYVGALSSDAVRAVFDFSLHGTLTDTVESARYFYSQLLPERVEFFIDCEGDEVEKCYRIFIVMAIAVAALLAFTQCNITGPLEKLPAMPLRELIIAGKDGNGDSWVEWEAWAQKELMSDGSELLGKFSDLQYIVFAKMVLMKAKDLLLEGRIPSLYRISSISWWLSRLLLIQQRLLNERLSSLFDLLQVFTRESLCHFGSLENVINYWGPELLEEDALNIVSMLHLEVGIMELLYGRIDSSGHHFESAQIACKLDFSVSGALGFRTVNQVEPKAQLLLVTRKNDADIPDAVSVRVQDGGSSIGNSLMFQHPPETLEASDVLMAPRILEGNVSSGSSDQPAPSHSISASRLKPVQQAVILARCLAIQKSSRSDELQLYKMGPYIEAIDSQQSSNFIIKYFSNILRIQWESTRSRTKQRAISIMDNLIDSLNKPSPGVKERVHCCFAVNIPTIPALQKEYGDLLVSCGLIGEAMIVYENLEIWDNLIYCYRLLDKKAAAVDLIKKQLSKRPGDPRLWCSLGDVINDVACYEKALEVSGNRSARALRALARSAYNKADYEKSKVLWESAMALNSLYQDGWFALGAAALKARDIEKALDGFTRAVQLDPENGEAWNNIACLHMINKRNKEAFVAFKEALKFKRNSWQMWDNYSQVAADIGNYSQAMEAINKVLDMTDNKKVDLSLLERLMLEIEKQASNSQSPLMRPSGNHINDDVDPVKECVGLESDVFRRRETENLIQLLGKILQKVVRSSSVGADIWGLYAQWHKLKGDLVMCSEALLKQVRAYQGSDLWRNKERFVKFAHASLELCKIYQEISYHTGTHKELYAAEMHLKSTIKQAANFSDTPVYQDLLVMLHEVQKALQLTSDPAA